MANESESGLLTAPAEEGNQEQATQWFSKENAEVVKRTGWKTPDDAIKGYRGLEKDFSGRVKMPTPESSAEEIRAFYQRTGCPENPEGYEVKVSENMPAFLRDEEIEGDMKKIAYEMGVSKQGFETIVSKFYERQAERLQQSLSQGEAQLKQELGDKYKTELAIGQRFAANCSNEFRQLIEQTGLGNNPIFIKEFIGLGKKTMNDSLIKGSSGGNTEPEYVPQFINSPQQYSTGEDEESKKAREWFTRVKNYKY